MAYVRKALEDLINREDPAWPLLEGWIRDAKNPVEILAPSERAGGALVSVQITTRSPLGAVIFHTGGLLVDHGWLRLLGSGHPRLARALPDWNFACGMIEAETPPQWLLIGDDVLGGFFAMNGGRFAPVGHTVWYFAPDTLTWEDTGHGYTDFLHWCLVGDLEGFYTPYRWPGWQQEVATLDGDSAFSIFPPLSADGGPIAARHRGAVRISELFRLQIGSL